MKESPQRETIVLQVAISLKVTKAVPVWVGGYSGELNYFRILFCFSSYKLRSLMRVSVDSSLFLS